MFQPLSSQNYVGYQATSLPNSQMHSVFGTCESRPCSQTLGLTSHKCDTAVPKCGQCIRANKTCDGYRSQLDLAFRNESDILIEKARAKSEKRVTRTKGARATPPAPAKRKPAFKNATKIIMSNLLTKTVSSNSSPGTLLVNYASLDHQSLYFNNLDFNDEGTLSLPPSEWSTFSIYPTIEELGTNFFLDNFVA